MSDGDDPKVKDAVNEIGALLAAAYRRRAKIRLIPAASESRPSTERLENMCEMRPHELTLTRLRKESTER